PPTYTHILHFFCHYSVHHRDLHSFPTRRSSDLPKMRIGPKASTTTAACLPAPKRNILGPRKSLCAWPTIITRFDSRIIRVFHPRDRKSTRLNSSHVSISYAVFCLKKKKKKQKTY